jgi:RNA polymerase sigma factor (sigma-70 family)
MTTDALRLLLSNEAAVRKQLARKLPPDEVPAALTDVYLRLSRCDLSAVRNPGGLLFRIAKGVIADHMAGRDSRCIGLDHEQLDALPGNGPAPDEIVEALQRDRQFHNAIGQLSPRYRAVLMAHLDDLTYKEIASALGITVDTVDTYLRRAKEELKDLLDGR